MNDRKSERPIVTIVNNNSKQCNWTCIKKLSTNSLPTITALKRSLNRDKQYMNSGSLPVKRST